MKITKQIMVEQEIDAQISEITLLSKEEYILAKEVIRPIRDWWWLRSPGYYQRPAAYGAYYGTFGRYHVDTDCGCVRPALRIRNLKSSNLKVNDKLQIAGYVWTVVIETADEIIALCDSSIGRTAFRKNWEAYDANNFEKSDVKKYLYKWAEQKGIIMPRKTSKNYYVI